MRLLTCSAGTLLLVTMAGCGPDPVPPYPKGLASDDPGVRIRTIRLAADRKDKEAVPAIVDCLDNDDEGVRFFAILALERITGTRLGYDYSKPACERAQAVHRWRRYVRDGPTATQPTTQEVMTLP